MKSLFDLAKKFHAEAFSSKPEKPGNLESSLKSIIGLLADNYQVDRKKIL